MTYEMRQILLATLPALSINDHEGIICLLVEARLQMAKKPDPLVARLLGRKAALAGYKHEMDERLDECLTGALHIAEQ